MAANSSKTSSAVTLVCKTGVDSKGKNILKKQKYGKIKPSATNQDIYDTIVAISALMAFPVESIQKNDTSILINQ